MLATSASHADNAKTNLAFAFALNSLFYSTLRMARTEQPADVKSHPVHAQIKIVKDHYLKHDNVVNRRKAKEEAKDTAVVHRIVERTVKENKRLIGKQDEDARQAKRRARQEVSFSSSESSESEDSSSEEEVSKPQTQSAKKGAQVAMHGATVVPVPAYIRNKQLLDKLKK